MIAQRLLAAGIFGLGAAAVGIGTGIFLLRPAAIADFSAALLGLARGAGEALSPPDADNEMRFYAVFWIAFGVIAIRAARTLPASLGTARILAALFFAGGAGRAMSTASLGAPHPLFVALMWIELLAAPALLLLSWRIKPADAR